MALVCYGLDQGTKALALARLDPYQPPSYLGGLLKFRLVFNPGAAFSFGTSATIVFTVLAMIALTVCLVYVAPRVKSWGGAAVTGLAIAGIAGNLSDRLFRAPGNLRGHVVDFIALPNFAVFNVADICITLTAVLVIGATLRQGILEGRQDKLAKAAEGVPQLSDPEPAGPHDPSEESAASASEQTSASQEVNLPPGEVKTQRPTERN